MKRALERTARAFWTRLLAQKHAGGAAFVAYAGLATSLVSAPLVARALGAEGRGELAAIFAVLQVANAIAFLGLPQGIASRFLRTAFLARNGVVVLVLLGIVAAGLVFAAAPILSGGNQTVENGLRLVTAILVLNGVARLGAQLAHGLDRHIIFNAIRASSLVLPSTVQITLYVAGVLTFETAFVSMVAGQVCAAILGLVVAVPIVRRGGHSQIPWRFSLHLWGATALSAGASRIDVVVLSIVALTPQVGVYAVALTIATAANGLSVALNQARFPAMVTKLRSGEAVNVRRTAVQGATLSLATGALAVVATSLLAVPVMGADFGAITPVVAVLVVALALDAQWELRVYVGRATEDPRSLILASAVAVVVFGIAATAVTVAWGMGALAMSFCAVAMSAARLMLGELVRPLYGLPVRS